MKIRIMSLSCSALTFCLVFTYFFTTSSVLPAETGEQLPKEKNMFTGSEEEFQRDLKRIESFRFSKELGGLEKIAKDIQRNWSNQDQDAVRYSALMLSVCQTFNTLHIDDGKPSELSQKYAMLALEKGGKMPVDVEVKLVLCLTADLEYLREQVKGEDWSKLRNEKAKLWLLTWQRLYEDFDKGFDFTNLPLINVPPPAGARVTAGAAPETIRDPKLRAEYEAAIEANRRKAEEFSKQHRLRSIERLFSGQAEKYLIAAYSKPPYNTGELKQFLDLYEVDKERKSRILKGVEEAIQRNAQAEKDKAPQTALENAENE